MIRETVIVLGIFVLLQPSKFEFLFFNHKSEVFVEEICKKNTRDMNDFNLFSKHNH